MKNILYTLLCLVILACTCGCIGSPPATTKPVINLDDLQGKWQIIQIIGPDGKGYEAQNIFIEINGDKAVSEGKELRIAFNADNSALQLYEKTEAGLERLVGEVIVTQTTDPPIQMLWTDRKNSSQETLLEKQ